MMIRCFYKANNEKIRILEEQLEERDKKLVVVQDESVKSKEHNSRLLKELNELREKNEEHVVEIERLMDDKEATEPVIIEKLNQQGFSKEMLRLRESNLKYLIVENTNMQARRQPDCIKE